MVGGSSPSGRATQHTISDLITAARPHLVNPTGAASNLRLIDLFLGTQPLASFGPQQVREFVSARLADGVCGPTVNRQRATLSRLCEIGIDLGWLTTNPVKRVKPARENPPRIEWLRPEQAERVLRACPPLIRTFVLALMMTACRRGEMLALEWADVDLEAGRILIRRSKNGDSRSIPIHPTLKAALRSMPQPHEGRVFPLKKSTIRGPWRRACVTAGIGKFRLHALRHTAISWMVQAGTPLAVVGAVAGHKSISMTMRYAHLSPQHLRAAVESIPALTSDPGGRRSPSR